jgi:hypothetical protein
VETAEKVINPTKQAVSVFAETQSNEIKDRIFDEFNSLAVVYQQVRLLKFLLCLDLCKPEYVLRVVNSLNNVWLD